MKEMNAPEDVAALCSRARMDASHYKVFQHTRRPVTPLPVEPISGPAPALVPDPPAPSQFATHANAPAFVAPSQAPQFAAGPAAPQFMAAAAPAFAPNPATQFGASPAPSFAPGPAPQFGPSPLPANAANTLQFAPGPAAQFGPNPVPSIYANAAPLPNRPTPFGPGEPQSFVNPAARYSSRTAQPYAEHSEFPVSELRAMARLPLPTNATAEAASADAVRRRWAMLGELVGNSASDPYASPQRDGRGTSRIPVVTILGLSGGCGRTTVAATMASALARMGERILLVHAMSDDMTPCHFGMTATRPGWVRSFVPRNYENGSVHIVAYDDAVPVSAQQASEWLASQLPGMNGQIDRILVQERWSQTQEAAFAGLSNACIVTLIPDVKCMNRLPLFARWLAAQEQVIGRSIPTCYLLNQFDSAVQFHADMRQWLRSELGVRLLPFHICRTDAITEALGTGTTLLEYASESPAVNDFLRLAAWTRDVGLRAVAAKV